MVARQGFNLFVLYRPMHISRREKISIKAITKNQIACQGFNLLTERQDSKKRIGTS